MLTFLPSLEVFDKNHEILGFETYILYCQTSDLSLRLEVDFVFPLSQEEEEEQEQEEEPSPKFLQKGRY